MLLQLFFSLLAVFCARIAFMRWKYDLWKIPSPPGHPFFGHVLKMNDARRQGTFALYRGDQWRKLGCPKIMKLSFMGTPLIQVRDMDFVKNVMMSKTAPFPKRRSTAGGLVAMLGNDMNAKRLLQTEHLTAYTKAVRRVYATGLQASVLKKQFPKLLALVRSMLEIVEKQRKNGPIDFQRLSIRMTLDVIGVVALDSNLGGLDESRGTLSLISETGFLISGRLSSVVRSFRYKYFPNSEAVQKEERQIDRLTAEWDSITREVVERSDPTSGEEPIWYGLKTLEDPETGEKVTYETLRAEIATVVLAGMDTTGHQLGWILSLLATYPAAASVLREELKTHGLCGKNSRELAFEDLADLQYLTAVVKEGMRIAQSISGMLPRVVPEDMTILGYRVPKGTSIVFPSDRGMESVEDWGDPQVFRPERWLTGEDMSHKYYFGFSYGPRDCAGQRLAMLELRMAIVQLLKHYEFSPVAPFDELTKNCKEAVAVEANDGIWLHVTPRAEANA